MTAEPTPHPDLMATRAGAPPAKLGVAVVGASGRMGRRIVALMSGDPTLALTGAIASAGSACLGRDAGELAGLGPLGVAVRAGWPDPDQPDMDSSGRDSSGDDLSRHGRPATRVVIDFSTPQGLGASVSACRARGWGLVVGTTGLSAAALESLREAAGQVAIVQSPNMSVGVNVLFGLVARVAATLGANYDIEIIEAHHRLKADAPSGTALGLAEAICAATDRTMGDSLVHGRQGQTGVRARGPIGMHAVRGGDIVGEHTVLYAGPGERVELRHSASSRDTFAQGALRAAKWVADRPPGLYRMTDVLGL